MSFNVILPHDHIDPSNDIIICVFSIHGDPGNFAPKLISKLDVVCFKNVPSLEFYLYMRHIWKKEYPYSVCHLGCKQAVFSIYKIKSSYRYPAQFKENSGNDIGAYEINIKKRKIHLYLTYFTRNGIYTKGDINVRSMIYRSLQAYNIAKLMKQTKYDSDYQILIGNLKLGNNLPRKCLTDIACLIQPKNASIMYGSQRALQLKITDCETTNTSKKYFTINAFIINFTGVSIDQPVRSTLIKTLTILTHCIKLIDHLINFKERAQCYQSIAFFFISFLFIIYFSNDPGPLTTNTWIIITVIFMMPFIFHHITYKRIVRINKPYEDDRKKLVAEMSNY